MAQDDAPPGGSKGRLAKDEIEVRVSLVSCRPVKKKQTNGQAAASSRPACVTCLQLFHGE